MSESGKEEIVYDDPSKTFLGIRFVLFGFDPVTKEQVRLKLLDGGGVDVGRYCSDCTHVIVDRIVYDDPICVSARRDGKAVVTRMWVDHSSDVGMPVETTSVMYRPLRDLNGIPGAKSLHICLTGYLRHDREDIMIMVGLMGASFSKPLVAQKVTHLICYKFEGEKYELAKRVKGMKIVNHRWLEDCLKHWVLLPEADYSQSAYELEVMEAEAKDSEEEQEEIPAQSNADRNVVTTPHSSKSSHRSPLKQIPTSNTGTPLRSLLNEDVSEGLNLSKSRVVSDQEKSNKLSLSAEKGSRPCPVSEFGQSHNHLPERIDAHGSISFGKKSTDVPVNGNVSPSGTMCTKQSTPEVSKSSAKSYIRKNLRRSSPVMGEVKSNSITPPSVNARKHNEGQNMMSLDIKPDELDFDGAAAGMTDTSSPGNQRSSILPEKRTLTTPSSGSKMQKISHTPATEGDRALMTDGAHVTSNYPRSRGAEGGLEATNAVDCTNNSPVSNCKTASPETIRQQRSKEVLETGLSETMGLRTCTGSLKSRGKATSRGSSKDKCTGAEVPENEMQGIKLASPGSRMETAKPDEFAELELSKGGKSNQESRMLGKRYLSRKAENSKQTVGKGHARIQKGSIFLTEPEVYSAGGEEMKSDEKLNSDKVEVPAMDNANGTKEAGESKSLEPEAEQTAPQFDETEAPDDMEEDKFDVAVHDDKPNNSESPHSVDKSVSNEKNVHRTGERITVNNSDTDCHPAECDPVVDQTDSLKNASEVKVTKDKKCSLTRSTKGNAISEKSTKPKGVVEMKKAIGGKGKGRVSKQKGSANSSDTDCHPAEHDPVADQTDSLKSASKVKVAKDKKCSLTRTKKANPISEKSTKPEEDVERKKAVGGKGKGGVSKQKRSANNSDTDCHPTEHDPVVDQTDSLKSASEVRVTKDKKCSLTTSKKANPISEKSTKPEEAVERKKAIGGKGKGGVSKKKGSTSETRANLADINQVNSYIEAEKENIPAVSKEKNMNGKRLVEKTTSETANEEKVSGGLSASHEEVGVDRMALASCKKPCKRDLQVEAKTRAFIVSGHRQQRKEFLQVVKRLGGKSCRDNHQWSYQATHFVVPDPIRRTEKFFSAAASGSWILKVDYLTACNKAGKFLPEEPYEWHKNGFTEDSSISLEAPRKWRLLRQRTGHGAFYGMRIVVYGELVVPAVDTIKRAVKSGDGSVLATSPPYSRYLKSGIDFAIIAPGMPSEDMWVQEFLSHKVPCVSADYLVEYVCKPGSSLDKHILFDTHDWAEQSLKRLMKHSGVAEEDDDGGNSSVSISCKVCASKKAREAMLICGSAGCVVGIHIGCCNPPLDELPKEEWICSECNEKRNGSTKPTSKSKRKR